MKTFPALAALSLIPLLILTGCTSSTESAVIPSITQGQSQSEASPTAVPVTPSETPLVSDGWSVTPQTTDAVAGTDGISTFLTDIRVGSHDGYDRLVLEYTGDSIPGWLTAWTDSATEQGRGQPIDITGPVIMDLYVTGTNYPTNENEDAQFYSGPKSVESGSLRAVYDSDFEGQTHVVIGMDQKRQYRITTEMNPTRIVIDFQTE